MSRQVGDPLTLPTAFLDHNGVMGEISVESRFFFELTPYSPVHTRPLSARACRRQHNGQSAKPLATAGDIPWLYPSADFHRHATTDEQQPVSAAYHLHRDVRRQNFHFDAVKPLTQDRTYPTITLLNANYSLYFTATRCNTYAMRGHGGTGAPACTTRTLEHRDVRRQSFHYDAVEPHTHDMTYPLITLPNANYS